MQATKEMSLEDIKSRLAEVAPEHQAAELLKIATDMGLKRQPNDKEPAIELSMADLERLNSGAKEEAAKVIKETAAAAERKYDLRPGEALGAAENEIGKALRQRNLKRAEDQIIGKRFASIIKAQLRIDRKGDYGRYLEEEVKHMKQY